MKLERGFLTAKLSNSVFVKESRENSWAGAESGLGSAVSTGGEERSLTSLNHSIFSSTVCPAHQGDDSVLTQRGNSHLSESTPPNIFL